MPVQFKVPGKDDPLQIRRQSDADVEEADAGAEKDEDSYFKIFCCICLDFIAACVRALCAAWACVKKFLQKIVYPIKEGILFAAQKIKEWKSPYTRGGKGGAASTPSFGSAAYGATDANTA